MAKAAKAVKAVKAIKTESGKKSAGKKRTGQMVSATLSAEADTVEESEISVRRLPPAELRWGTVTIDEIRSLQQVLAEQSAVLGKVAEALQRQAMTSLDHVDGVTKGNRGKKLVADFTANLNRALSDAIYG